MKTEFKIAIRYIFSKHSFNFITIINFISLIGITIGVAALIVVLSIFNAFQSLAVKQIVGFDPHIKIESNVSAKDSSSLLKYLQNNSDIESFAQVSESRLICFKNNSIRVVNLLAISDSDLSFFNNLEPYFIVGNFTNERTVIKTLPKIAIGAGLADALHCLPGDTINFTTPSAIENSLLTGSVPNFYQAVIKGIFQSNVKDYDYSYVFGSYNLSKTVLSDKFQSSLIYEIRLNNLDKLEQITNELKSEFPKANILSWKDLNKEYYNVMKFEKMATTFILGLIVLVAIFNVFASLTMTIIEKKKDISILRAMGATQNFIQSTYLYEGIFVGSFGSILGGLLGVLLCYGQAHFKWFRIDNTKYIMDSIPVLVNYYDIVAVVLLSFVLTILATIYPSMKASKLNIIENIREE
jgi:lipoprotein-releasing system permease protein